MQLLLERLPSPIGTVLLVSDGEALRGVEFEDHADRLHQLLKRYNSAYTVAPTGNTAAFSGQLRSYFDGDIAALDDIPVCSSGSAFQRRVWAALRDIPAGTTTSYGRLAAQLGHPSACRAVGLANGANPVAIVVPCHRVIGADGSLTGYGGGLRRKQWLLRHEAAERSKGRCATGGLQARNDLPAASFAPSHRGV